MLRWIESHFPWVSLVCLAAGALWIVVSAASPGETSTGIPAPQAGFMAPDFSLETTEGDAITLSDLRGQPVVINLWASWCGPCRAEMPALEQVYQTYREEGFVVLAVNATNQDNEAGALAFQQQYGLTFPILLDRDGQVSRLYNLRALPSTYFVDQWGMIDEVVIGGPMAEALLLSRVERLLRADP